MALEHRIQRIYRVTTNINFKLGVGTLNRIFAGCQSDAFLADRDEKAMVAVAGNKVFNVLTALDQVCYGQMG